MNVNAPGRMEKRQHRAPKRAARRDRSVGTRQAESTDRAQDRNTVMVVDDDEDLLRLARAVLQREGFHVDVRTTSPSWQDLQNTAPCVLFMDIGLGTENGMEACLAIKSNEQFRSLPVILISGQGETRLREEVERSHADGFLSKPFSAQLLVQLASHYQRQQAA